MDYNQTINLPKTDFPHAGGAAQAGAGDAQALAGAGRLSRDAQEERGQAPLQPPRRPALLQRRAAHGPRPHKGNQGLHHPVLRMRGYYTPYIPGWDNHGMPIESAIIKEQKLNRKAMSVPEFRSACHDYAPPLYGRPERGLPADGRPGRTGSTPTPPWTRALRPRRSRSSARCTRRAISTRASSPCTGAPHDETALAEAEIEYQDDPCTTVYVKFPMHDDLGKLSAYDRDKLFFVIWTTTIWTLPGNLAHRPAPGRVLRPGEGPQRGGLYHGRGPDGQGDAPGRLRHLGDRRDPPRAFFENMLADHPFLPKTSRLLLAGLTSPWTPAPGCVHTAPGFGADDYETCRRYGMDMVVPVGRPGPPHRLRRQYAGMKTDESNPVILADMKESDALRQRGHRPLLPPPLLALQGPHHLPGHPPVFCSVESFKDEACAACDDVRWVPGWASTG